MDGMFPKELRRLSKAMGRKSSVGTALDMAADEIESLREEVRRLRTAAVYLKRDIAWMMEGTAHLRKQVRGKGGRDG